MLQPWEGKKNKKLNEINGKRTENVPMSPGTGANTLLSDQSLWHSWKGKNKEEAEVRPAGEQSLARLNGTPLPHGSFSG